MTAGCLAVSLLALAVPACADAPTNNFDMPSQPMGDALSAAARSAGIEIVAPTRIVRGLRAPALKGAYPTDVAIRLLLEGSGLVAEPVGDGYVVKRSTRSEAEDASGTDDSDIVVTGSRIRGAPIASTTVRIDAEAARNAGQATVVDIIRAIPQNFSGGQNPGIGNNVPEANGLDIGGGSSFNLRGLGGDATLTLLNGHRLPYSAAFQSVDVSAIPLDAVDRIEIVADGASAIYGSDAVAGVANIILKRDFSGLRTSARIGASTDGGNDIRQYAAVAGQSWGSGGLLAAYQFDRSSRILSSQRSYAETAARGLTLFPHIRRHSFVASAHQELAPGVVLSIDGLYGRRWKATEYPLNPEGDLSVSFGTSNTSSRTFVVSPSVKADLGRGWSAEAIGSYGKDRVMFGPIQNYGTLIIDPGRNCFCNRGRAAELGVSGPVFTLPGGRAQLAAGIGWRDNTLVRTNFQDPVRAVDAAQDSHFAYAEINLPFVSHQQEVRGIDRLNVSAAIRYERYPGIDDVMTPKLGLIYAPVAGFTLKGSWGKSFRAPTLIQLHQVTTATALPPEILGATGFPADSNILYLSGGNTKLKPERATSWSITAMIEPAPVPGLRFEIGVFHTRYKDRIVEPIVSLGSALTDPIYADLVVRGPTLAQATAALASATIVQSFSPGAVDPATIVALINDYYVNASRQTIKGVDLLGSYQWRLAGGSMELSGNASLLDSAQVRGEGQASRDLAGVLFNPPHFRARGTASWTRDAANVSISINRIGGVADTRVSPARKIAGMTTLDAALRLRPSAGFAKGFDLILAAENLFNAKPAAISTTLPSDTPYDSTNYTPIGRFVSITLAKSW
jgi:outer membrane receptor protein involved in Fe transport